jgi:S1-C subfamily serine protease
VIIAVVVFVLGVSAIVLGLWQLTAKNITPVIESINYRTVQIVFMYQQKAGDTTYDITPVGTGMIVNNDGYVITANHLIDIGEQYMQQSQAEIKKLGVIIVGPSAGVAPLYQLTNDFNIIARDENHDLALLKIKMTQSMTPEGDMEAFVHYIYGIDGTLNVGDAPFTTNISQNSPIAITGYTSAQLVLETKSGSVTSGESASVSNATVSAATGNVSYDFTDYYQTDITANSIFNGSPVYSTSNMAIMGISISTSQNEFDNSGEIYIIPSKYILDLLKSNNIK